MAYDSVRHVVVLFGGEGPLGDTWEWNGTTWTQKFPATAPSARDESAMVFDSIRGVVVLFGGGDHNSPQALGETWEYPDANGNWVRRANSSGPGATTGPSPRVRHAMAYDSARGKTVLFGGFAAGPGGYGDTWEWDGTAWSQRATTGPGNTNSHAMAYDAVRGKTVFFGGEGFHDQTWEWDGTAWTQRATTGPTGRFDTAMAYAGGCPRTMLFGGYDGSGPNGRVGDTWEWDGTAWTQLITGPSARSGHKMVYDSFRRRFVLFGGTTPGYNAETWEFITATPWTRLCGSKDNFLAPYDPTVRSVPLQALYSPWVDLDDPATDSYRGHTFGPLPPNTVRAELTIRMKPLRSDANNDALLLGSNIGSMPGLLWSPRIETYSPTLSWTPNTIQATTFVLDLANLPGGVDILDGVDGVANRAHLDVVVEDDTAVDWIELRVWTCPPQRYFFGSGNTALGQAVLTPTGTGQLVVSNLGSSFQDGIAVGPINTSGICFGFLGSLCLAPNVGTALSLAVAGTVQTIPASWYSPTEFGKLSFIKKSSGCVISTSPCITLNAEFINPYDVYMEVQILLNGIPQGPAYPFLSLCPMDGLAAEVPEDACIKELDWLDKSSPDQTRFGFRTLFATPVLIHIVCPGGDQNVDKVGDEIRICPPLIVGIGGFSVSSAELRTQGIPSFTLGGEALQHFGLFAAASGADAIFEPSDHSLTISNLGSSGQDGVSINFGKVNSFNVGLDPIVDLEGNQLRYNGAYLEATARGSVDGVPDQLLGVTRITQVAVGNYAITADFTAIGSPTQHVQVFNQGALVADFPGHSGPVGSASAWMSDIGKLGGQTECFVARWPGPTSFLISGADGTSYVGDELRILAEGATQTINYKSDLQLLTAGIPEITLVSAQAVPQRLATLANISTRLQVGTADRVMIGGFIIQGSAPKRVIIRAIGPSLMQFGIPNPLADPVLELHGPAGFVTITNNNWRDTQEAEITATGIPPTNNLESAIVATLAPGAYTAIVRGLNAGTGVGSAEVYDLDADSGSFLANISTRGFVQTGDNIMIGGFIVVTQPTRVIIRAIGPSLTLFGVPDALANPTLELRDSNGALLLANNDWQDNPAQAAELTAAGLAPTNNLESGLAVTLPPGLYTALVAGVNNATGNALVEAYALP